jgi:hypothetical protein
MKLDPTYRLPGYNPCQALTRSQRGPKKEP